MENMSNSWYFETKLKFTRNTKCTRRKCRTGWGSWASTQRKTRLHIYPGGGFKYILSNFRKMLDLDALLAPLVCAMQYCSAALKSFSWWTSIERAFSCSPSCWQSSQEVRNNINTQFFKQIRTVRHNNQSVHSLEKNWPLNALSMNEILRENNTFFCSTHYPSIHGRRLNV